jgi:DNA-binding Lrp family transcriptional regulator
MVTAIVLLHVERDQINPVAEQLADVPGVTEVYSVAGRYDLAAVIRTKTNDQLAEVITQRIRQVRGILDTETLIAFRTYSRHDLDAAFSLGAR